MDLAHTRTSDGQSKERTVNSRNMLRVAGLALAGLLATTAAHAQAAPAAGPIKVGVINVRQAIVTTGEGKQASTELQSQFASRQNELQGLQKQIEDIRQRLSTGGDKLSPEEQG